MFKLGGAQAIAAMAYGTESVPKVDKIFGPGNTWVTEAKAQVDRDPAGAARDYPAGPSEVLVIADAGANPAFIAADLLSQAEHGADSQVLLVTTSAELGQAVIAAVAAQKARLTRAKLVEGALAHSSVIVVDDLETAVAISNRYAPEHLILQIEQPRTWLDKVTAAGSVFLGPWTPEAVGDYCSGTNHVLPTYGFARRYSSLGVADFVRSMTVQELTLDGLRSIGPVAVTLAGLEGLDAHAWAVNERLAAVGRGAAHEHGARSGAAGAAWHKALCPWGLRARLHSPERQRVAMARTRRRLRARPERLSAAAPDRSAGATGRVLQHRAAPDPRDARQQRGHRRLDPRLLHGGPRPDPRLSADVRYVSLICRHPERRRRARAAQGRAELRASTPMASSRPSTLP